MLIADRALTWRDGERDVPIEIRIFAPVCEQTGAWACRYQIQGPDWLKEMTVCGFDAVQALVLALQTIGVQIYTSEHHESGNLFFDKPGSGQGFPVGQNVRDLLVGNDAKYLQPNS